MSEGSTFQPPPRVSSRSKGSSKVSSNRVSMRSPRSPLISAREDTAFGQEVGLILSKNEEKLAHDNICESSKDVAGQLEQAKMKKQKLAKLVEQLKKREQHNNKTLGHFRVNSDNMALRGKNQKEKLAQRLQENKVLENTVAGLMRDNATLDAEIAHLRNDYKSLNTAFLGEMEEVKRLKAQIWETRRNLTQSSKDNLDLQARLRSTRVAKDLIDARVRDAERRNKAVRSVVSGCVHLAAVDPHQAASGQKGNINTGVVGVVAR